MALKSVDPSVLPRLNATSESRHVTAAEIKKAIEAGEKLAIPLYYAPSVLPNPLDHFTTLISQRLPVHRKWMWVWLLVSPVTAPFAIIPIMPNIPFFFCLWRAYNHWRAHRGAKFLQELLDHQCIESRPHTPLDNFYTRPALTVPPSSLSSISESGSAEKAPSGPLLFTRDDIPNLLEALQEGPGSRDDSSAPGDSELTKLTGLGPELARAVDQSTQRIAKLEGKENSP